MKLHQVEQGTEAWLRLRLGIPTASMFSKILTPGGWLSASARKYAYQLTAERILNRPLDSIENLEWVARGKELEPDAVKLYEFEHEASTAAVGFITTDDGRTGASPDRLVGDSGLLEIKCPAPHTHVGYMLDGVDAKYRPQVQGQLYVSEREWTDFLSYSPEMPRVLIRTTRDEPYIRLLRTALDEFNDMREEMFAKALEQGAFVVQREVKTAHQQVYDPGAPTDADELEGVF